MTYSQGADPVQEGFDRSVIRLARKQHGLFTREQLDALGVSRTATRHRLEAGRWERVGPIVFRLGGSVPTWRQQMMAACLAWGVGAVASHRGAASLRQLATVPRVVELIVPRGRTRKAPGRVYRCSLDPEDVTVFEGIPTTTVARTFIDLGSIVTADVLEEALDDALRRGLVSIPELHRRVEALEGKGRRGVRVVRALLAARVDGRIPESVFETRLNRLLSEARLPKPVRQFWVEVAGHRYRADFAYPSSKLAIEADGYGAHIGRARFERDRIRRTELTIAGWRVIHITWPQLEHEPSRVVGIVRAALGAGEIPLATWRR